MSVTPIDAPRRLKLQRMRKRLDREAQRPPMFPLDLLVAACPNLVGVAVSGRVVFIRPRQARGRGSVAVHLLDRDEEGGGARSA